MKVSFFDSKNLGENSGNNGNDNNRFCTEWNPRLYLKRRSDESNESWNSSKEVFRFICLNTQTHPWLRHWARTRLVTGVREWVSESERVTEWESESVTAWERESVSECDRVWSSVRMREWESERSGLETIVHTTWKLCMKGPKGSLELKRVETVEILSFAKSS